MTSYPFSRQGPTPDARARARSQPETTPEPRERSRFPMPSRRIGLLGAALALATAAFWFVMITDPPTTQADPGPAAGTFSTPLDLPSLNADAI